MSPTEHSLCGDLGTTAVTNFMGPPGGLAVLEIGSIPNIAGNNRGAVSLCADRKGFQPEKGRAVRTLFHHAWALSDLCVWGAVIWGWSELFGRSACNNN